MVSSFTLDLFNDPFFIGFDRQFKDLEKTMKNSSNYPPHNIAKVVGAEDMYVIELAIAGFKKEDIEVEQDKNILVVKGSAKEDENKEYIYKGIGGRSFIKTFSLAEHVQVVSVSTTDGILTVVLMKIVPEDQKPKKFDILDLEDPFTPKEHVFAPTAKKNKK
jgi:molecular chaperone IbpA